MNWCKKESLWNGSWFMFGFLFIKVIFKQFSNFSIFTYDLTVFNQSIFFNFTFFEKIAKSLFQNLLLLTTFCFLQDFESKRLFIFISAGVKISLLIKYSSSRSNLQFKKWFLSRIFFIIGCHVSLVIELASFDVICFCFNMAYLFNTR